MRLLRVLAVLIAFALLTASAAPASASVIWGYESAVDNLSSDAAPFGSFGSGAFLPGLLVPNLTSGIENGLSVARLGDTIYRAAPSSGDVSAADATTNVDRGVVISTGFPGIARVATDGTFIYVASNHSADGMVVNKYDTAGNLVSTIAVGEGSPPDGPLQNNVEGTPITFTADAGSAGNPYDVYQGDGALLASGFTEPPAALGATNDGVSDVAGTQLLEYAGAGTFPGGITLSDSCVCSRGAAAAVPLFSSVLTSALVADDPVPEPATLVLLGTGLAGFATLASRSRRRRRLDR